MTRLLGWIRSNAVPLLIGAIAGYLLLPRPDIVGIILDTCS